MPRPTVDWMVKEFDDEDAALRFSALLEARQNQWSAPKWDYWVEKVGTTRSARSCGGIKWAVKRKPKNALRGVEKKTKRGRRPFADCVREIPTVGDLRKCLASVPDDEENNDVPLVYSHDDEGNCFQCVVFQPAFSYVKNQTNPRGLKPVERDSEDAVRVMFVN